MPFTEHLRELRNRLLIALGSVAGIAVLLFWPSQFLIKWIEATYLHGIELHAFGPADAILTEVKVSFIGAIVIGLPILLYQLWMFVVPAFHPRTRKLVYAFIVPSTFLSLCGLAFAHFIVIPRVIRALIFITQGIAVPTFGLSDTLNFILILFALFALIFQLPIVMVALARIGIVNVPLLKKYRRHALFGFVVVGGLAAPDGSPITMALLAIPMYVLYEISIWTILILEKSWKRSEPTT